LFPFFLSIYVSVNNRKVSGQPIENAVPELKSTWTFSSSAVDLGDGLNGDIHITGAINGEIRVLLQNIKDGTQKLEGRMVLCQNGGSLRTYRNGFGLAIASVRSFYNFGGIADFLFLQPTAGREALTTQSLQLLQKIVARVDECVS